MSQIRRTFAQKRRLAPRTQERELFDAVARGDWDEVEDWCALKVDRRADQPPLHQMASTTSTATSVSDRIITLAKRFHQDLNQRSATGFSPLRCALLYGSLDAVRTLLDLGANPNETVVRHDGAVPLWLLAIDEGPRPDIDRKLLLMWRAGAQVNVRTPAGLTDRELLAQRRQARPNDANWIALEQALNVVHEDRALRDAFGEAPVPVPTPVHRSRL